MKGETAEGSDGNECVSVVRIVREVKVESF